MYLGEWSVMLVYIKMISIPVWYCFCTVGNQSPIYIKVLYRT